jgi:hypothetical protein
MLNNKKLYLSLIVFSLSIVTSPLYARWKIDIQTDSMSDEKIKTAFVTNNDGHSLKVFSKSNGAVYATFRLNSENTGILSEKLITFRVDKNKPVELMASRKSKPSAFIVEPKWVIWRILPNTDGTSHRNVLNEFISGNVVTVRYFLFSGGYKETKFTLKNSLNAIKSVMKISMNNLDKLNDLSFDVYKDSLMACGGLGGSKRCRDMTRHCQLISEQIVSRQLLCPV